jgi:hypothetical protein
MLARQSDGAGHRARRLRADRMVAQPAREIPGLIASPCIGSCPSHILLICLDTYMPPAVYKEGGIYIRDHCGAEPSRDPESAGLKPAVGRRDRASASYAAADRVQAPAGAARGRFRGIHGGRTAASLPAEARTAAGGGCLAGAVSSVLVASRGCSGMPPRPDGRIKTNESNTSEKKGGVTRPRPRI